jgi:hypothetical protein
LPSSPQARWSRCHTLFTGGSMAVRLSGELGACPGIVLHRPTDAVLWLRQAAFGMAAAGVTFVLGKRVGLDLACERCTASTRRKEVRNALMPR